jgi:predicted ATP-grasp superfamily ATP-dependent carboligase
MGGLPVKVLVLGAGGAASNGFAHALHMSGHTTVGANSSPNDLLLSACGENHLIAHADDYDGWRHDVLNLAMRVQPDLIHAQNDGEVEALARFRTALHTACVKTFLPSLASIETCRDKWASYQVWRDAGIPVPRTELVTNPDVLFRELADRDERWLRPRTGAGGQRSLKTGNFSVALDWVKGSYGEFTVAEVLTPRTVTVQRLYWHGKLICSQQRTRASWANAGSTTTGVSGSTGIGVTSSHSDADDIASAAVAAVDSEPHGIWGVDMARDNNDVPCVTEINIGRFFTTSSEFFAKAGFNMAADYVAIGVENPFADPLAHAELCGRILSHGYINPLPDGIKWIRAMDREPILVAA